MRMVFAIDHGGLQANLKGGSGGPDPPPLYKDSHLRLGLAPPPRPRMHFHLRLGLVGIFGTLFGQEIIVSAGFIRYLNIPGTI